MSKKGLLRGIQVAVHVIFILLLVPVQSVHAAAQLEITPIAWNVIGLDSNNVNVGPNNFPVGARVCNTGNATANNVSSAFQWETVDPTPTKNYIDTRLGSALSYSGYTLNPSQCVDFYYEVEVTRNSNAYNDTRRYYITATADTLGTVSTPRPRELFVEYLVSQSRNSTTDVKLDGVSVAPGGTMALVVGQTYNITLVAKTATNGYEQIESFINFPNTIFQVNSVNTTYSADTSTYVSNPSDMLYGDGCRWENDPNSPKYRSCWDVGKAGGNITVDYNVTIIGGAGTSNILNTLIYDFSGSSYHYNADYSVGGRIAVIIDPTAVTIAKNFNPDPTNVNGISKLTFTLTNPNGAAVSGVNFSDTFPTTPGVMTVANPPNASTSGCGTPTFLPTAGSGSLSFSNGTIAANGTCTVSVDVTVPVVGSYNNTSSNVFVGTVDTGHNASDTLTVNTQPPAPACTDGVVLARWDFTGSTLTATIPNPAKVSSAIASYTGTGTSSFDTTLGNPTPSWKVTSGWAANNTGYPNAGASPYFQFLVDTSNFTNVKIQYDYKVDGNWANRANNYLYTYINANGGAYSHINTVTGFTKNDPFATVGPMPSAATTTGTSTTGFRINAVGQQSSTAAVLLDNVIITGCGVPDHPTLTKAFSPDPVAVNGTSTLTFTITNPNPNVALNGLAFTDLLPAGVTVANGGPTSVCGGSLTTTAPSTISFTGGSLASGGSCNIPVTVTVTTAGPHTNVSGFISSTQTGTNSTSTGSASDTITAILPPAISKLFSPNPILVNGTSTLTFTINNPNQNDSLTGVAFSDTYPAGLVNASPLSTSTSCGGTVTAAAGGGSVSFSGGTISGGSTCTVTVDVTAALANTYNNTSGAVTANITGGTDTASDSLVVEAPAPAISFLKQVGLTNNPNGAWSNFLSVTTNQNVYYKFIIENIGDVPFSPISVSDLALQGTGADPAGCSWPATLPVADSNDDDHIAVCVVGPVSAASGSHLNTATASGTYGGSNYTDTSSATYATVGLSINKTAIETYFTAENDQLHYSYAVENTGSAPLVGPVTVTDDKATVSCPAVDTVGDNDNYLDPGEILTCTATYTVTAADVATGSVTNTAFATADGVNSPNDDLTIPKRLPDLTISKANSVSGTAVAGSSFIWTLTVSNIGLLNAAFADGQTLLSDPLPAGATYGSPSAGSFTDITNSGNISCSIDGSNVLTCVASGSSVTVGASTGSFTVSFTATPTAGGSLSNTATVDPNNNVAETNETNNTGTNSLFVFDAAPAKSIVDTSEDSTPVVSGSEKVAIGEMVRYHISAQLPEGSFTNVQFVDNLPDGLQFLDDGTAKVAFVCTNTGSDCITSSTLSGAGLLVTGNSPGVTPAFALPGGAISGGPFTSGVNPTFSLGNLVNSDGDSDLEYVVIEFNALVLNVNSSVTINQGTNNVDGTNVTNSRSNNVDFRVNSVKVGATSSNATISVAEPAITNLAKSVSAGPYLPGGTVTYSLTFSNTASGTNATTAFDIVLTDVLDANLTPGTVGITNTQGTSGVDSCAGGTTFTAGSTTTGQTVTVNITCLDPGKSVTVTIGATIGSVASGIDIDNTTSLTYTSLPGANGSCAVAPFTCTNIGGTGSGTGERNGSGGAGADSAILNNYADASATVTITVVDLPDALDDSDTTDEGTPVTTSVLGNDDLGTEPTTITSNTQGANGSVSCTATDCTYTPNAGFSGTDSYTYTITDDNGNSDTATVTITVVDLPDALDDSDTTDEGTPVTTSVLGNDDLGTEPTTITSNTQGANGSVSCTATDCTYTPNAGFSGTDSYTYTITDDNGNSDTATVTITVTATATDADLKIQKTVNNASPIVGDNVVFTITVTNDGPSNATGVVVNDLLPAGLQYVSDNSGTTGTSYDDATGVWTIGNLNSGSFISLTITARVVQAGSITNTATVTGNEPDPDGNNNRSSTDVGGIFDPPTAIKTFNAAGLPEMEFRLVWINSGNAFAVDVQITDNIPAGTTYVAGSVTCEPRGSSTNAVAASSPLSGTAVPSSFCGYDAGNNRIQWQGSIGPDDGNLTEATAANEVVITFRVTVANSTNQVLNQAFSRVDVDDDGDFDEETVLNTSLIPSNRVTWNRDGGGGGGGSGGGRSETVDPLELPYLIPVTGFAPGQTTILPEQPQEKNYLATDVWVEVPRLGISLPITGVPLVDGEWDVSWLGAQAGWLEGTAFPSWKGNSALTAHVTLADGKAGPFVNLGSLKWGDKIIVHAYGYTYVYEVRENKVILPSDTSVLKHEEKPWLTLLTCKNYNETTGVYANRIAVRAVLTGIQMEPSRVIPRGAR